MIDRLDYLRDERLLRSLTEVEGEFKLAPDIFGGFDLRACAVSRWIERAWIRRTNPRDGMRQSGVPVGGQNESEVAVLAAPERGGHRRGIGLDLGSESL